MKIPPFLLGAALILWGWQTGLWILAISIAIILEASHLIPWRWDLSKDHFKRISDICTIILIILIFFMLIAFIKSKSIYFSHVFFQYLPVVFFPIIAAQIYSHSDGVDIRNLFLLRHLFLLVDKSFQNQDEKRFQFNLSYPYFALCILSASETTSHRNYFYFILLALLFVTLWFNRCPRFVFKWFICFILAAIMGIGVHIGIHNLHLFVEQKTADLLSGVSRQEVDPFQRTTGIGDWGKLKLSDEIILRVTANNQQDFPLLLRESTYNKYIYNTWIAFDSQFTPIKPENNHKTWQLSSSPINHSQLNISTLINQDKTLLKLPNGTFQIDNLPVLKMEKNQYGVVKTEANTKLLSYQIKFDKNLQTDSPPTEQDLLIPESEKQAIAQIIKELNLENKSTEETLKIVKDFFQNKFSYSLNLLGEDAKKTPLSAFLLKNRAGHCEYFASATTLILRGVSIPTRYSVGFSVHEFSNLEKQFIVRAKNAHAWTLVYINGGWQEFDTTPSQWTTIENANTPKLRLITDLWSFLWFKISLFLPKIQNIKALKYWWILIIILVLLWLFNNKKIAILKIKKISQKSITKSQKDQPVSDFYLIEKSLNDLGFIRGSSESLKTWIERLKRELPTADFCDDLTLIIELYYGDRFDPQGLQESEKIRLKSAIQLWLKKYRK